MELVGDEEALTLDGKEKPEFDIWRWVDFWYPAAHVVNFKRDVYAKALRHFAPLVEELFGVVIGTTPPRDEAGTPSTGPGDGRAAA